MTPRSYIAVAVGTVTVLSSALASGMQIAQWPAAAFAAGAIVMLGWYWRVTL